MRALLVRDVMTRSVVTVSPDLGYKQIADLLVDMGVSAVPVVGDDRKVIGVVSEADLLHKVEFNGAEVHAGLFERRRSRRAKEKAAGETARDLMTAPAVTIAAGVPLTRAARLMEQHEVKRLPVLDEDGSLIGIVARRDLLRRYLRTDADIRADVVDGVLLGVLWLDPLEVDVTVADGHVTLRGKVDRRTTAQIAARLTRALDGVVGVSEELEWGFDDTTVQHRYSFDA
ncbi:CBS domain-containing protein [Dactylosporangium vinaceum]|uniref:CBS domain-containing protein n=1 Tax=Dactylosporangium vinaceum TaxID=53362 RepID=A0ABV5MCX5_9ACTN|nr:CBS domain-containing protein [Dactylosporangium vinaceum]UAC00762.1 CBS domain-containing protein [Dactylosporangium vinaceum]